MPPPAGAPAHFPPPSPQAPPAVADHQPPQEEATAGLPTGPVNPAATAETDWLNDFPAANPTPSAAPSRSAPPPNPAPTETPTVSMSPVEILLHAIADDDISEIHINGPAEVVEKTDICYAVAFPGTDTNLVLADDIDSYHDLINDTVLSRVDTTHRIGTPDVHYIEGRMTMAAPDGGPPIIARVHVVCPPVVDWACVTIAKRPRELISLDTMVTSGTLSSGMAEFMKAAVRARINIVVSGMMGAGKTTLMQALFEYFDRNDRVALIEETPELEPGLASTICMRAPSTAHTDPDWVSACVRNTKSMRLNRVVLGESRGAEANDFLSIASSVADGSLVSLHAWNPRRALDKLITDASKSPYAPEERALRREVAATINLIIQVDVINARHMVTGIEAVLNSVNDKTGAITTATVFAYDPSAGAFRASPPPPELVSLMAVRGVPVRPDWFEPS